MVEFPEIKWAKLHNDKYSQIIFLKNKAAAAKLGLVKEAMDMFMENWEKGDVLTTVDQYFRRLFLVNVSADKDAQAFLTAGSQIAANLKSNKEQTLNVQNGESDNAVKLMEGVFSGAYNINAKKSVKESIELKNILFSNSAKSWKNKIEEKINLWQAIWQTRDLVNLTSNYQSAVEYSSQMKTYCESQNIPIKMDVLDKKAIENLGMGGLLAVNQGSFLPPTFNVLTYKPKNAVNEKPVVLVGKGIVYDTGGLSLKPTANSMDLMKSDMAGSAATFGAICAVAKNKLPVYTVTIIPATDNRPGNHAIAPGDVITMMNGKTVEVMNTDAEGRLVLADGLTYGDNLNPDIILTMATLTGAAVRAIGTFASVCMGNVSSKMLKKFVQIGEGCNEKTVEFPFWDEYAEEMKSDVADLNNLGSGLAGAITAGKFLENFTKSPYIHVDIAGPAFLPKPQAHLPKGGTGYGVNLLYHFIKNQYCN